jgi:mannose-6-phosphate isomerase-like protein (cupin superfamily)
MKVKSETTSDVDARTNQAVDKLQFDVNSHDEYLQLREQFSRLPKTPMLLHVDDAPVTTAPLRTYNWFLTSEQSGGSIVIHMLTLEPGFAAGEHHHPAEEEFFFVLEGELEMTIGNKTAIVGPNTFAYAPPYATHAFMPHGDKPCRVLHWNSPGGHERLSTAQQRLERERPLSGEERRRVMEDHDYVFHDTARFDNPQKR